jgi:F-type H+-transporting ATPase subunit a
MNSPIEQFDKIIKIPLIFKTIDISITNVTISMLIVTSLILFVYFVYNYNNMLIPLPGQMVFEELYKFVVNIVRDQMGKKNMEIVPIILSFFSLIWIGNMLGLSPFGISFTSYMQITFFFSITIWISTIVWGFSKNRLKFLKIFVPKVGWQLVIVMIIIELLSYTIRAASLAIRLSANITAGHTLLNVIGGLNLAVLNVCLLLFPITFILLLLILVLEFGIAFVQSYVFVMLTCIYIYDAINIAEH